MVTIHTTRILATLLMTALTVGCISSPSGTEFGHAPAEGDLKQAQALYDEGRYTEAMIKCIDLSRTNADLPGLAKLQADLADALADRQRSVNALRSSSSSKRMLDDIDRNLSLPDTYGLKRHVYGEDTPLVTEETAMQTALTKPVTVHLDQVTLSEFILAIGKSENINMIADSFESDRTLTVHAEKVPLSELLEFAARNLGVQFYVGQGVIWVTPRDPADSTTPMETRCYRLRKGLSNAEVEAGKEGINIMEAIERFVPKPEGAELLFDPKAHVLLAKNTRQNLSQTEAIIGALDVSPPQVLIEARFISTGVNDLRELGIDWILNSPVSVTKKQILKNGSTTDAVRSQIANGAKVGFTPFSGDASGLNLTYQGLLTDPMFQAVIHALEMSGKTRTLSVPKVMTVNNREAIMRIGEDFRYFEQYDVQSVPSDVSSQGNTVYSSILVPVGSPTLQELGIELDVTPSVGADRRSISLRIIPSITEFVRYEFYEVGSSGNNNNNNNNNNGVQTNGTSLVKLPIFRKSVIETEVVVQSGETVAMGGLVSSSQTKTRSGVPFLSSIPLIGRLFEHDGVDELKQNLLVFVTATIVSERGEDLVPAVSDWEKASQVRLSDD